MATYLNSIEATTRAGATWTYAEFSAYVINFLWRAGDATVIANIDTLIRMANAELNRDLRVEDRTATATLPVTALDLSLPDDYKNIRVAALQADDLHVPPFTYIEPDKLLRERMNAPTSWSPYFSLSGNTIMLSGPLSEDTTPPDLYLTYYRSVPDFLTTDTSWVADNFLDLYTYCVLKHSTLFVREDERMPVWQAEYTKALMSALEESEFYRKRGVSASKPLPRQAGINRARGKGYYGKGT